MKLLNQSFYLRKIPSHLERGAWIEIGASQPWYYLGQSHLERGAWIEILIMKDTLFAITSHLERGAWIEIDVKDYRHSNRCRTSKEVRGLKCSITGACRRISRRTSKEVRGLK